jgi:hypothetical protein
MLRYDTTAIWDKHFKKSKSVMTPFTLMAQWLLNDAQRPEECCLPPAQCHRKQFGSARICDATRSQDLSTTVATGPLQLQHRY